MKIKPAVLISLLISIFSFFIFLIFRTIPVSKLWKEYHVLYVYTTELTEHDILNVLEKNGCQNVLSYGTQILPVSSPLSPVQVQSEDSYINLRKGFFTDKSNSAYVFYVPDSYRQKLERSIFELNALSGTSSGTDSTTSFPWIAPFIALFFAAALLFFSREKLLFSAGSFFPVFFAFSRPLYTVACASMFILFSLFILQKMWKRKGFLKTFRNSPYSVIFTFSPFLILIFSSLPNAFFYILCIASTVSSLFLFSEWEETKYSSYNFKPVFIRTSKMIPVIGHTGIRLMGLLFSAVAVLLIIYSITRNISYTSANATVPSLPAPVSSAKSELPNLNHVIEWSWNTITFPYRKIGTEFNKHPVEGEKITIPDYMEKDGIISEYTSETYVYNSKFRNSVVDKIQKIKYPSLEKMMISQGKNTFYGYSKGSVSSSEKLGRLLLVIFLIISAALSIYYIVGRKRYGLSI